MTPYHRCRGQLHRKGPVRCWHRGVVEVNKKFYCHQHDPRPKDTPMDESLKMVVTKMAEHIVRLAGNNEGKAIAIADRTADLLLSEVRRIAFEQQQKGKTP